MVRPFLIFSVVVGISMTVSKSVDPLQSYYPDVTNCFKGVARNESLAVETNKNHYTSCIDPNSTTDEPSLSWKFCMLAFKGLMSRQGKSDDVIIFSVIPNDTAQYVGDLLGINWFDPDVQNDSRVKKDSQIMEDKLWICFDLRFRVGGITEKGVTYEPIKLQKLIDCIEDAVKC